jgi:hypothetical protein
MITSPKEHHMPDLDMSDVYADAANDPTLDRVCDDPLNCPDDNCPLIHADLLTEDVTSGADHMNANMDAFDLAEDPNPTDDSESEMRLAYWDEESDWG